MALNLIDQVPSRQFFPRRTRTTTPGGCYNPPVMSGLTPPTTPLYRITLFFGPEALAHDPDTIQCVFNVKKRSWKAGVQVAVHLHRLTAAAMRAHHGVDTRLAHLIESVPDDERDGVRLHADDLFHVELARLKLDHALEEGVRPENQTIPVGQHEAHLAQLTPLEVDSLLAGIRAELDLPGA